MNSAAYTLTLRMRTPQFLNIESAPNFLIRINRQGFFPSRLLRCAYEGRKVSLYLEVPDLRTSHRQCSGRIDRNIVDMLRFKPLQGFDKNDIHCDP